MPNITTSTPPEKMPHHLSELLKNSIEEIMINWEQRVNEEIEAAQHQHTLALRDSIPEFLSEVADALSRNIERTELRIQKQERTRLGKKHGKERADSIHYTIDQLIFEYHILRQVIFDVLEKDDPLTPVAREVIVGTIEQAVNDAATEFTSSMKDLQDQLSYTMAHDLRNSIMTANTSAELILKRPGDEENCTDKANRILKSMHRLDHMITDLLDFSRIKAGEGLSLEFKECDLEGIARVVVDESKLLYGRDFILQTMGKCSGYWNQDGIRRVMENLVSNAVKYGKEATPITISIQQDTKTATFSVHNEGQPIAPEDQEGLFDQFKRLKSSTKKPGWGLGLTLVRGMVKAHKGSTKVESEMGKGTTFIVNLPKDTRKNIH